MSYLVLVVLSLLWLGFFLPSLLQSRRTSSPLGSVDTFRESLTRISTGHAVTPEEAAAAVHRRAPRRSRREIARQRDVLTVLAAGVMGALILGLSFGGVMWWLLVPTTLVLATYVMLLRLRVVQAQAPRRTPIPAPRTLAADPAEHADAGVVPSVGRRDVEGERREFHRVAG